MSVKRVRKGVKAKPAVKATKKPAVKKKGRMGRSTETNEDSLRRLQGEAKQAWQPPPMADTVMNPEAMKPKGDLSLGMQTLLETQPGAYSYRVYMNGAPIHNVQADGHEITTEGRLILRAGGFKIVAIFNRWDSFRIAERQEV
jgi:hypothetical protein